MDEEVSQSGVSLYNEVLANGAQLSWFLCLFNGQDNLYLAVINNNLTTVCTKADGKREHKTQSTTARN